jgi:hypothetical protein
LDSPNPRGYRISVLANPVRPTIGRMHADGAHKKISNPPQKKTKNAQNTPKMPKKNKKIPKFLPSEKKKCLDSDSD